MASASTSPALPFDATSEIWADVVPVYQDDGPSPLCPILYSPSYSKAMDLIRALLPQDELSPRTLALTEHLSRLCPSSYTIWHFRARILIHGPESGPNSLGFKRERLERELSYLDEQAARNMKNYQVWQHRKLVVTALGDASRELAFVEQVLRLDSKNYHTWVYRQWVLAHFGGLPKRIDGENVAETAIVSGSDPSLWRGELAFVDSLLQEDARNNSAWNHRFFCIFGSKWAQWDAERCQDWWKIGKQMDEIVSAEIAFTKGHIATIPNNASAWNYLRGVAQLMTISKGNPYSCASRMAKSLVPSMEVAMSDPAVDAGGKTPSLALEWLLDDAEAVAQDIDAEPTARSEAAELARRLVDRLCIADPIRRRYWQYRLHILKKKAGQQQ